MSGLRIVHGGKQVAGVLAAVQPPGRHELPQPGLASHGQAGNASVSLRPEEPDGGLELAAEGLQREGVEQAFFLHQKEQQDLVDEPGGEADFEIFGHLLQPRTDDDRAPGRVPSSVHVFAVLEIHQAADERPSDLAELLEGRPDITRRTVAHEAQRRMALPWREEGDSGVVVESELFAGSDVPDCIGANGLHSVEGRLAVGSARVVESRLQDEHAAGWVVPRSGSHDSGDGHVVVDEGMGHAGISRGAVVTQA